MISNFTFGCISKESENRVLKRYLCAHVHSSIIHNRQEVKASKYPQTDKWISKMRCTHTTEYYLVLKGKEILTHG